MFKKMVKIGKMAAVAVSGSVVLAAQVGAVPLVDVSGIAVDTTALGTIGGVVIAGLASIWGFRKIVKSINRS